MDIPQKDTPKNVEDLSEVQRISKWRWIMRLHYFVLDDNKQKQAGAEFCQA